MPARGCKFRCSVLVLREEIFAIWLRMTSPTNDERAAGEFVALILTGRRRAQPAENCRYMLNTERDTVPLNSSESGRDLSRLFLGDSTNRSGFLWRSALRQGTLRNY